MRRIKLIVDYIGTNYKGWQVQPNLDTVQGRLQAAVKSLTGETVAVIGSGRTDSGVHALAQVAHFDTNSTVPAKNFYSGLNHFLPSDIRVLAASEVTDEFHARFSAVQKTYCYRLYLSSVDRAIYNGRAVRVSGELDIDKMTDASRAFIGEHDFTSFMSTGADTTTAVRTVKSVTVTRRDDIVEIFVTANGFLYNMVRLMVGVIVSAGKGKIDRSGVSALIAAVSKDAVRLVMPPDGLYLVSVEY